MWGQAGARGREAGSVVGGWGEESGWSWGISVACLFCQSLYLLPYRGVVCVLWEWLPTRLGGALPEQD